VKAQEDLRKKAAGSRADKWKQYGAQTQPPNQDDEE
jgi:hypothetical protein